MAIGFIQQEAFYSAPEFRAQVEGVVKQQALLQYEKLVPTDPQTAISRERLAQLINRPGDWPFSSAIVADAGWAVTFDAWAADPVGQEGAILSGVQKWWTLVTGLEFLT